MSINGMGGDSRKNDLLRPGDVAGPSAATDTPVLAASGFKVETVDEVVVELPGQDFVLSRSFSGSSRLIKSSAFGPHALGGWMLSTDVQVVPMLTPVEAPLGEDNWRQSGFAAYVAAPVQQSVLFQNLTSYFPELQVNPAVDPGATGAGISKFQTPNLDSVGRRTFRPMGPGLHRLVADRFTSRDPVVPLPEGDVSTLLPIPFVPNSNPGEVTLPVWRLVDPGNGTSIFFRGDPTSAAYRSGLSRTIDGGNLFDDVAPQTQEDEMLGRLCRGYLWQQIDPFGNSWHYEYTQFQTDNSSNEPRLTAVYLHGKSATDSNTRAIVRFYWDVVRARDGSIVNDYMDSAIPTHGAANGNSLRIRLVTVERPVENVSAGAFSRSWIVTDRVEY